MGAVVGTLGRFIANLLVEHDDETGICGKGKTPLKAEEDPTDGVTTDGKMPAGTGVELAEDRAPDWVAAEGVPADAGCRTAAPSPLPLPRRKAGDGCPIHSL